MVENTKEKIKFSGTEHTELDITGMTCIGCANSVKTYLSKLEGISKVDLNFSSEVADIDYNPKKISLEEIKTGIRKLGYDVDDEEDEKEAEKKKQKLLKSQKHNIFTAVFLSLIVMAISMKDHLGLTFLNNVSYSVILIVLLGLTTYVVFRCGLKFLKGAYQSLKNKSADMNTLISMGTLSSYIYSVVITVNHVFDLNIAAFQNSHEVYYETAAMIVTFLLIGNYLEVVMKAKTQTSIKKLKGLQSKVVTVIRDGKEIFIPFKKVKKGDTVVVKTGDKIPVDGVIIEGFCVVDESSMTGESLPVEKKPEDKLLSGTVMKNGFAKMTAENVGSETMLSKIITLVNEASNSKPQIQRLADKISSIFVPLVVIIAISTFLIWNFIVGVPFENALLYAVAVLIIACPCALGLASPMAVVIGVGRSAENGILFNNVEAIEKLKKVDTLCFDKTGTLTSGEMKVKDIHVLNGLAYDELMKYVFSVEKYSNHPIAKSINSYSVENNIEAVENVSDLKNEDGMGITAKVDDKEVVIGNTRMLENRNIEHKEVTERKGRLYVSIDGTLVGLIDFEDEIKPESKAIIEDLKSEGYNLFMISGDGKENAKEVAEKLGIDNFSYKTMPDEKERIVSKLQSEGKNVAMIGDGINDAPSLARANVGIAMGTGTDIAIDSADVILVKGDLRNIYKAIKLSDKTVRVIKQNIFWAFFYNAAAIPAAAGVFAPIGFIISPVMAAMLMAFSDVVTVIGNSLRLKYMKIK